MFIATMISAMICSSCCKDDPIRPEPPTPPVVPPKPPKPPVQGGEKTIFMYLPWSANEYSSDGGLYDAVLKNIEDIKKSISGKRGMDGYRLIVYISTPPTPKDTPDEIIKVGGVLMEIKYEKEHCVNETIKVYAPQETPLYTRVAGLSEIIGRVIKTASADQYAMMIGCHGTGWLPKTGTTRAVRQKRAFGGTTPTYQTDINTLAEAIKRNRIKMQYILFDDCNMSNIETAYDLRDVTQYLIGCCSEIMAHGMPYTEMWPYLTAEDTDYEMICKSFLEFYKHYSQPYGNIGVVYCPKSVEMAAIMKEINKTQIRDSIDNKKLQALDGYEPAIFFDMASYVNHICKNEVLKQRFDKCLEELVPYKAHTPEYYTMINSPFVREVKTYCGITISDSNKSFTFDADKAKKRTAWWKATH